MLPCRNCGYRGEITGNLCKCKADRCKTPANMEHDCDCPLNRNDVGSMRRLRK